MLTGAPQIGGRVGLLSRIFQDAEILAGLAGPSLLTASRTPLLGDFGVAVSRFCSESRMVLSFYHRDGQHGTLLAIRGHPPGYR